MLEIGQHVSRRGNYFVRRLQSVSSCVAGLGLSVEPSVLGHVLGFQTSQL